MGEEVDLHGYVRVLVRNWKWIAGVTLLAAAAAFAVTLVVEPIYESEAVVAIIRSRTDIAFDPRMATLSEVELGNRMLDVGARREALVALASSGDVAAQVLDEIGAQLGPGEHSVRGLLKTVEAAGEGDLILIGVSHRDPITACLIANTWALAYERYVNGLYGTTGESNVVIASQVVSAWETYETAQAALEVFVGDNRIAALEREIAIWQESLDLYGEVLADCHAELRTIEWVLAHARALRAQVGAASTAGAAGQGNALALLSLYHQAFGGIVEQAPGALQVDPDEATGTVVHLAGVGAALPLSLQVDLGEGGDTGVQLADVEALIELLEARRGEAQVRIDALVAAQLAGEEDAAAAVPVALLANISDMDSRILALEADLVTQLARQQELEQSRDLAWTTYQTLARKQAEVEVSAQITGTEVRLASRAIEGRAVGSSRWQIVAASGVAGLTLAALGALTLDWWKAGKDARA
jgi:uncharacterized protein involved in exopolysaccharide biosynthesis